MQHKPSLTLFSEQICGLKMMFEVLFAYVATCMHACLLVITIIFDELAHTASKVWPHSVCPSILICGKFLTNFVNTFVSWFILARMDFIACLVPNYSQWMRLLIVIGYVHGPQRKSGWNLLKICISHRRIILVKY